MKKFTFLFAAALFAVISLPLQAEDVTVEEFPYECILVPSLDNPAMPHTTGVAEWWNTFAAHYRRPALCGVDKDVMSVFTPVFHFTKKYKTFVITVTHTCVGYMNGDGDGPWFMLDEFYVFDGEGKRYELTADNFSTNALYSGTSMGTLIDCKEDESYSTTFQTTAWENYQPERGNHYLCIELPEATDVIQFAFENRWNEWGATTMITSFDLSIRSNMEQLWSNLQRAISEAEALGVSEDDTELPEDLVFSFLDALDASKDLTEECGEDEVEEMYNYLITSTSALKNWMNAWYGLKDVIAEAEAMNVTAGQDWGQFTPTSIDAFNKALEDGKNITQYDEPETISATRDALRKAINALEVNKPELGEYFYLYNTGTEGYLYTTYSNLTGPGAVNCGWYCRTEPMSTLPMSAEYIWSLQAGSGTNIRLTSAYVDMAYGWTSINNDCEIYTGGSDFSVYGAGNESFYLFSQVPGTADSYMGICDWNNRSVGVYKDSPKAQWQMIPVDTATVKELISLRAFAPKAGTVFTIWNALQGDPDNRAYLYEDAEANTLLWEAIPYTPQTSKYMWTFDADEEGALRIKNLKTGNWLDNADPASGITLSKVNDAKFTMTSVWANWTPAVAPQGCKFIFTDTATGKTLKATATESGNIVEGADYNESDLGQLWFTTGVPAYACTIAANGYGSFYADYDVIVPDDVTAYYAEIDEATDRVILHTVTDRIVKAGNGVVVNGPEGVCYFRLVNGAAEPEFDDAARQTLKGTTAMLAASDVTTGNVYVVSAEDADLTFTALASYGYVAEHQAYFVSTKNTTFTTGEGTSVLQLAEPQADAVIYDIFGRRVAQPQTGLYIIDGKKVIVK